MAGWEVVCQDTVLFPEGGGQNCDQGQLGGRPVLEVLQPPGYSPVDRALI